MDNLIFLSYANEDKMRVERIYLALKEAGLNPWMDKPPKGYEASGLSPGDLWDTVLRQKIREAEVLLLFLSKGSVEKRGYVQREYRLAVDQMMDRPTGAVSVIPVLLERCEVPDIRVDTASLTQLQWFALYESDVSTLVTHLRAILMPKSSLGGVSENLEVVTLTSRLIQLERELYRKNETIKQLEGQRNMLRQENWYIQGKLRGL